MGSPIHPGQAGGLPAPERETSKHAESELAGKGTGKGERRAGNHHRELCRGEAEPVRLDWGQ